jgi:hypothetical protein
MPGCGCNHSFAVICAVFASMAAALFLAEDRCLHSGGAVSDAAWICEAASGVVQSLWSFVTPGILVLVVVVIGIPVYFAVMTVTRRWILWSRKGRKSLS